MPRFPVPAGRPRSPGWEGGRARPRPAFPDGVPDDRRKQAAYELGVICQMGFPGYFLVVADLCHAKDNGIRVGPGRGSAAGALSRTRWASPSSTRSSTSCCSSASSTPSACRCPTSTSTSTSAGAAT